MTTTQLDAPTLRSALAGMATPVVVVTTTVGGRHYGFTANSFTSVSMEPPLLGVYLAETASSYDAFMAADRIAFNVLAHDQGQVARQFATSGIDKFAGLALSEELPDVPALAGTMVTLAGTVHDRVVIGDHVLLLATPTEATSLGSSPLVYHRRDFYRLGAS
ncbi:flavin reductase family protein [Nocardioides sp.]|uniref:flavin reductase family protein n=1 Tax=Nocardioides sp. TaxID=35761 RepID=UPI0039E2322D